MIRWLSFLLLIFLSVAIAEAQGRDKATIKRIDAYCKTVDAFLKQNARPQLVVADISDNGEGKPKWKSFASKQMLENFRRTTDIYSSAFNWRKNKHIIFSAITLSSPSGDWVKYLKLYYRDDGTLAKGKSELRTFYGDLVARQSFYFDKKGRMLKKTMGFSDLDSGKPIKVAKSDLGEIAPLLTETNNYKSISSLPFAHLLER